MNFERGFKAYANQIALDVRNDLKLDSISPLCPWGLAEYLCIPVVPLQSLSDGAETLAGHVDYLAHREPHVFSAMTIFRGTRRIIVHNDAHAPVRQRSDLAHELAHALLIHPPHPLFCSSGQRMFDRRLEAEAGWLGPVLLVPNEAARWAAAEGMDDRQASLHFGVSIDLMSFRLRMSGALRIVGYR
jgi:uncharacterized protein DUF955